MSALEAIKWCEQRGVLFRANGDKLLVMGASRLSAKQLARVRELKTDILAELQRESREPSKTHINTDYLLQLIADARNEDAAARFETARYCRCGSLAPTQWRINGAKVWRCEDCFQPRSE